MSSNGLSIRFGDRLQPSVQAPRLRSPLAVYYAAADAPSRLSVFLLFRVGARTYTSSASAVANRAATFKAKTGQPTGQRNALDAEGSVQPRAAVNRSSRTNTSRAELDEARKALDPGPAPASSAMLSGVGSTSRHDGHRTPQHARSSANPQNSSTPRLRGARRLSSDGGGSDIAGFASAADGEAGLGGDAEQQQQQGASGQSVMSSGSGGNIGDDGALLSSRISPDAATTSGSSLQRRAAAQRNPTHRRAALRRTGPQHADYGPASQHQALKPTGDVAVTGPEGGTQAHGGTSSGDSDFGDGSSSSSSRGRSDEDSAGVARGAEGRAPLRSHRRTPGAGIQIGGEGEGGPTITAHSRSSDGRRDGSASSPSGGGTGGDVSKRRSQLSPRSSRAASSDVSSPRTDPHASGGAGSGLPARARGMQPVPSVSDGDTAAAQSANPHRAHSRPTSSTGGSNSNLGRGIGMGSRSGGASSSSRGGASWAVGPTGGASGGGWPRARPVASPDGGLGRPGVGAAGGGGARPPPGSINSAWLRTCTPVNMEATYPDLQSFAAAVREGAASWHPLVISAALNHAARIWDALDRQQGSQRPPPPPGSTAAAAAAAAADDGTARSTGGRGPATASSSGSGRATVDDGRGILRETLDRLHAAFLPHIPSISNSRYAVNALWVCAKTGYWGIRDSGFVPAILRRLRADRYLLLMRANGQSHGNLWWALSQYDQQMWVCDGAKAFGFLTPPREWGQGQETPGSAAPGGGGGGSAGGTAAPEAAAAAAPAAGGMDILNMSASIIRRREVLDEQSFKTQEFSNIILGAARLGYSSDSRFIDHLLSHMVKHPGPFKPQAISNTIYALGELFGVESFSITTADEEGGQVERGAASCPETGGDGGAAAAGTTGRQPAALWSHVRALTGLGLRLGLHNFSPQELCNLVYGLARLGLRTDSGSRIVSSGSADEAEAEEAEATTDGPPAQRRQQRQQGQQQWVASASVDLQKQEEGRSCNSAGNGADKDGDVSALHRFVARVAEHLRDRLQGTLDGQRNPPALEPQTISVATWALATIGYVDQSYYTVAVQAALRGLMSGATSLEWGIYLWGLGMQMHQPPREVIRLLYDGVRGSSPAADGMQAWAMLPWAIAVLDLYDTEVVSWISSFASPARIAALEPQGLANCLWSLAAMPEGAMMRHAETVAALVEAADRWKPNQFAVIGRVQLWQVHVELEAILNGQPSTTTGDSPTAGQASPAKQPAKRRGGRRPKGDASGESASADGAPIEATTGSAPAVSAPASAVLRRLGAPLVAAAREALLEVNQRRAAQRATALHASVYTQLRYMMLMKVSSSNGQAVAAATSQPQQQEQDGRPRRRQQQRRGSSSSSSSSSVRCGQSQGPGEDGTASDDAPPAEAAGAAADARENREGRVPRRSRKAARDSAASGGGEGSVFIVRLEQEWLVEALGVRVDLCVWLSDGRVVVVEVDGPSHFFRNQWRTRLPNTALRDRQLGRVFGPGNVLSVPYWEWDATANLEAKTAYMARLLGL